MWLINSLQKDWFLVALKSENTQGESVVSTPSRFLSEPPESLLVWHCCDKIDPVQSKQLAKSHLSCLKELLS